MAIASPLDRAACEKLFDEVSFLLAGHQTQVGLVVLEEMLVAIITLSASDREHAKQLIEACTGDLDRGVAKHWDYYKSGRGTLSMPPAGRG